jgi:hypothetical protein
MVETSVNHVDSLSHISIYVNLGKNVENWRENT